MGTELPKVEIEEHTTPYPPPFRWLKRSLWTAGIVLVLLIVLRLWWGWYADRQMQKEMEAIRARGEPIEWKDFDQPDIPDSENAAWYLQQAAKDAQNFNVIEHSYSQAWWANTPLERIAPMVANEQAMIEDIRQAQNCHKICWNSAPSINQRFLVNLGSQRDVVFILNALAAVRHRQGNDAEAAELLHYSIFFANAMHQNNPPTLVSHLVGIGLEALINRDTLQFTYGLNPSGSSSDLGNRLSQLVVDLTNERQYAKAGRDAWITERVFVLSNPNGSQPMRAPAKSDFVVSPLFILDEIRILKYLDALSVASSQSTWPIARRYIPKQDWADQNEFINAVSHALSSSFGNSLEDVIKRHFEILAERRAAVLALAMVLYRSDHGGNWPASLNELAPKYIPAIPIDPLSPVASTFIYKRDGASGPIIYSVGENGIDDGGSERNQDPHYPWNVAEHWIALDAVFHFTYQAPATKPNRSP
jgi:hypothetical protein